ncbi:hypothetical protein GCM10010187_38810 [Actinomadura coerulea]|nr:hypothetical protein GCM10010187_38810 [Actinomadura coerulea]
MALADPSCDQLRVLRAEVDDEDGVKGLVCDHQLCLSPGRKGLPVYGPLPAPTRPGPGVIVTGGDPPITVGIHLP